MKIILAFILFMIFLLNAPLLFAQGNFTAETLREWTQTIEKEKAPVEIITTCEPDHGIVPICNIYNPEDIVVTPSENWILFSERPPGNESSGNIGALRLSDHKILRIYSPEKGKAVKNSWGSDECHQPPSMDEFMPLGMDLFLLKSNELRLLVVNRSTKRSTIEYFEISELPNKIEATWRGCVRLPPGILANSVATIPSGGFVVSSHPIEQFNTEEEISNLFDRLIRDEPWGKIREWTPDNGWRDVPGGHTSAPNGILVSADSEMIYFATLGSHEVVRITRIGDSNRTSLLMPIVDNLRWTKDKKILAASLRESNKSLFRDCGNLKSGACGMEFAIVEIDPETFKWKELIHHQGPPIGCVTSALKIGNRIYMGTAFGDRMAYKDLTE